MRPARHRRRCYDRCFLRRIWDRYGPHLEIAGWLPIVSMLGTILWFGFNFVRDTQAYGPTITQNTRQMQAMMAHQERMDQNIELLMRAFGVKPLPKTMTEKYYEHVATSDAN